MKKVLMLFFILSSMCFANRFKYYKEATLESCVNKLNELHKTYKIVSYQIVPAETGGSGGNTHEIHYYNMIIEVTDK